MAAQEFDVVLMDVQMPEMDGLQATAAIREGEKETGGHLPIVAMTAHALKGDRERCLAAGMDGYLSKPINKEALFRAIDEAIGEVSRRESEQLVETTSTANPTVVNWPQILELVGGDPKALAGILRAYLVEMCEDLQLLREAVAARDAARLSRPAHKLLGAMRFFGAETAAEHARELESMNEHANWNHAVNLAVSLEQEIGRLLPEIEAYLRQ